MAVRYSGDAEVRLRFRGGVYKATVRDPFFRWEGTCTPRARFRAYPATADAYDDAAVTLLLKADEASGHRLLLQAKGREIIVSRLFQSPCPLGPPPRLGRLPKPKKLPRAW